MSSTMIRTMLGRWLEAAFNGRASTDGAMITATKSATSAVSACRNRLGTPNTTARRGSPDPVESVDRRSPISVVLGTLGNDRRPSARVRTRCRNIMGSLSRGLRAATGFAAPPRQESEHDSGCIVFTVFSTVNSRPRAGGNLVIGY